MCLPENVRCTSFLFFLHFLCYPRFSYRRYKTEKYISYKHANITYMHTAIQAKIVSTLPKKQSTHTRAVRSHTHWTAPFRKKIKCTHINCMQLERDALRVIKYSHRHTIYRTHTAALQVECAHAHIPVCIHTHTAQLEENLPCVVKMLFLAATSREEFHSEYLAVKTARSLKFQILKQNTYHRK